MSLARAWLAFVLQAAATLATVVPVRTVVAVVAAAKFPPTAFELPLTPRALAAGAVRVAEEAREAGKHVAVVVAVVAAAQAGRATYDAESAAAVAAARSAHELAA